MQKIVLIIIAICILVSCNSPSQNETPKDYMLINEDGIYVEQFDSTNISENRYTENNQIYVDGLQLSFDYYYQDKFGDKYKFEELEGASELEFNEMEKAWKFVKIDSLTDRSIDKVQLTVKYGLEPMINHIPDYNQTIISYKYPQVNSEMKFSSSTGVIENEKNVWIHPPRERLFMILELNPFPFIQAPYKIGNNWEWSLRIGSAWGDSRWKTWEGSIENKYQYEIIGKELLTTELGELNCFIIQSIATSSIGTTSLLSHFSETYGFVKLDYTNIDSTKIILELVEIE